jgi:hypothetical protein
MDPIGLIRSSARITFRTPQLWALTLLLYCTVLPAFLLAAGFGAATAVLTAPSMVSGAVEINSPLPHLFLGGWIAYILVTLVVLTATSMLSWAIQAAMVRASDAAAEGGPVSIRASLRLGKQRWQSLAKLALTFGVAIQALGILPLVVMLAVAGYGVERATMLSLLQTVLLPVTTVLGILLFLLTMSIALEDVRPRAAIQRVWKLMRGSWWGFVLAYLLQVILALGLVLLFVFLIAIAAILFISGYLLHSSLEYLIGGAVCVFSSPVGLFCLTFVMVFSTVFFTQIYRAAAKLEN